MYPSMVLLQKLLPVGQALLMAKTYHATSCCAILLGCSFLLLCRQTHRVHALFRRPAHHCTAAC
jgi:hypothetical protein